MENNYKFIYKESKNTTTFTINFCYNKNEESNQDDIFNTLLMCIMVIARHNSLSNETIEDINKFLKLARHSSKLDVRDYITGGKHNET